MKEIRFTLYEILGYFVPGVVAFAGLYLTAAAFLEPRLAQLAVGAGDRVLVAFAVLAYLAGHVSQAFANVVLHLVDLDKRAMAKAPQAARLAMSDALGAVWSRPVPADDLLAACDAFVVQRGKTETRDVYVYREGFYRGLTVGFAALLAGIISAWVRWTWPVPPPSRGLFVLGAAAAAIAVAVSVFRFIRFARYRVESCVLWAAVLLVPAQTAQGDEG